MLGNVDLPMRIKHRLVSPDHAKDDLLIHRLGGGRGAFLEQIGAVNLLLCLERVECHPMPGKARCKVAYRLRTIQSVQRKVGLRKLLLPQPGTEGINRIVSTRYVFSKAELR